MSDIRDSMREFRFLEEKRKLAPLTQAEEQRWVELGRTLGIFELAEANPDDVAEVDPNDVLLVEPEPEEVGSAQASGPADGDEPVPLAQNFEWVQSAAASSDSIPLALGTSPARATTASLYPLASEGAPAQSESAPATVKADTEPISDPATPAAADTTADEGDTWNGNTAAQDEQSPVIDLSASDATPGGGSAIIAAPTEPASSDAPSALGGGETSAANGAPPEPPSQSANDMPEPWGGEAAAQAFPKTNPQFQNPIQTPSASVLEGERRVVVHFLDGQVRRGSVRDLDVAAGNVPLESAGSVENIPVDRLKAIFFMRAPGSGKPSEIGQRIRLMFQDGRQVLGFSTDYQTGDPGFFLIPADLKTNTERIFVYRWSVYSIAEE